MTIGFATSTESNEQLNQIKQKRNETEDGLYILAICLVLLYAGHFEINCPTKKTKTLTMTLPPTPTLTL